MKTYKEFLYECGTCNAKHFEEQDADVCCSEPTIKITIFKCGICNTEFDNEHDANECCANRSLKEFGRKE